jgi:hypothetical protein
MSEDTDQQILSELRTVGRLAQLSLYLTIVPLLVFSACLIWVRPHLVPSRLALQVALIMKRLRRAAGAGFRPWNNEHEWQCQLLKCLAFKRLPELGWGDPRKWNNELLVRSINC